MNYLSPFMRRKIMSHRSVRPLLSAVFSRPPPQLRVPGRLHVHGVDDVEELFDHGHLLVHEVNLAVQALQRQQRRHVKHQGEERHGASAFSFKIQDAVW